jgi:hypothetical protein
VASVELLLWFFGGYAAGYSYGCSSRRQRRQQLPRPPSARQMVMTAAGAGGGDDENNASDDEEQGRCSLTYAMPRCMSSARHDLP